MPAYPDTIITALTATSNFLQLGAWLPSARRAVLRCCSAATAGPAGLQADYIRRVGNTTGGLYTTERECAAGECGYALVDDAAMSGRRLQKHMRVTFTSSELSQAPQ